MSILYQQNIIDQPYPYKIFLTSIQDYPPHFHEEYEIIYNLDEPFELGVGETCITLECGDIYIVEPRIVHTFKLQYCPRKRLILQFKPKSYIQPLKNPHLKSSDQHYQGMLKILVSIMKEHEEQIEGHEFAMMAKIYDMMTYIVRQLDKKLCTSEEQFQRLKRTDKLQKVFDYIDSHYRKKITLGDVSAVADYSTYYFTRFFKASTGMTFKEYLNGYRVMAASEELMTTDLSIMDIALEVGFESLKTFNRVFKKLKGCSPTAYRQLVDRSVNRKK